jgi:hypothetical protein
MEIRELLACLDQHRGSFPEQLVAEAVARREDVIPIFLGTLEAIDSDPEPWLADQGRMAHIHAMYLLAIFRETRAYPLLVRIFSRAGEFPFDLAGDVVTQDLGRILASVSGGDVSGMAALIENEQANEYVRSVAMDGMVSLVTTGQRSRDEIMAYFLQLFPKLERKPGAHWDGLANVCADLWPEEAMKELRRAYEDGLVDTDYIDWQDVEDTLEMGKQAAMERARHREPLITNMARDMGWMQCFHKSDRAYEMIEDSEQEFEEDLPEFPSSEHATAPIRRSAPKIGRNAPCPCGSGKKFKKCCADG